MVDILRLFQDYGVPYDTQGANTQKGWVNCRCPYCGDTSNHLGWNLYGQYFNCWKCGKHFTEETLAKLTGASEREIRAVLPSYGFVGVHVQEQQEKPTGHLKFVFPGGNLELTRSHICYLQKRGFNVDYLVRVFDIIGTGPTAILKGLDGKIINYRHRVLAPIVWEGKTVSFQCRDITGKAMQKYMACPEEREIIHHKHILYGASRTFAADTAIAMEGITDVWRFGVGAFATFGIQFTIQQVRAMAKIFKTIPVMYDGGEIAAKKQANKLVSELKLLGVHSFRVDIEGDPGGMSQEDANYLKKQLL